MNHATGAKSIITRHFNLQSSTMLRLPTALWKALTESEESDEDNDGEPDHESCDPSHQDDPDEGN